MRLKKGDLVRKSNGKYCYGPLLLVEQIEEERVYVRWILACPCDDVIIVDKSTIKKMKIVSLRITHRQYVNIINKGAYIDHELNKTWVKASYADENEAIFKLYSPIDKTFIYCSVYEVIRLRKISPLKEILKIRLYPKTILEVV